ncbi:MAG: MFS transporter [Candidatus Dadabacteria bacterium]|nr:MFS transporter [Candidatus Dadabacteria bacterium]MCY4261710.1 MFS transporter [Candidatus Dadabacteria bacterium]
MSFVQKYRDFSLVTLGNFFFFCNFSSFFLLPLFITDIGGDEARIGYVMGTFGVTSIGVIPFAAFLIDHYGRRRFMIAGSFLMFLVSLLYILISDIDAKIFILRLIQGVAFAFFFTSAATAVSDYIPSEIRAYGLALFGAFTIASYSVGPTVGELVIERAGYTVFFIYTSMFSLLALVLCFFSREGSFTVSRRSVFRGFFGLVFSNRFRVLLLTNLIIAIGLGSMLNFFSVFLDENEIHARSFFLTYSVTVILIRVLGGKLPDIIERRKIVLPSMFIMILSFLMISSIDSVARAVLVSFVFSIGYGIFYPTVSAMIIDRALDDERGTAMGAFNMSFSIGINFFAFALGLIARDYGFSNMYRAVGVFMIAGCIIFTLKYFIGSGRAKRIS